MAKDKKNMAKDKKNMGAEMRPGYDRLREMIFALVDSVDELVKPINGWMPEIVFPERREILPGCAWPGNRLESVLVDCSHEVHEVPAGIVHTCTSCTPVQSVRGIEAVRECCDWCYTRRQELEEEYAELCSDVDVSAIDTAQKLRGGTSDFAPVAALSGGFSTDDLRVGDKVLLRTVAYYYSGRVVRVTPAEVVLCEAAWVSEISPRLADAMATGTCTGIEPYPRDWTVPISRAVFSDIVMWPHALFLRQL